MSRAENEFEAGRPRCKLLLLADRVVDGIKAAPIKGGAVLIDGRHIVDVGEKQHVGRPSGAKVIELHGRTLMPGLIDAHLHFFGTNSNIPDQLVTERDAYRALRSARDARRLLDAGFTTVRCLGSSIGPDVARATRDHIVPGPRVVAAGQFIAPTGATWDHVHMPLRMMNELDMLADGVDEGRAIVRRRTRAGAEVIKITTSYGERYDAHHAWGDSPFNQNLAFTIDEIRAIVDEAHRNNLKVSSHSIGDAAVRHALEGGVDIIEHAHAISDQTRELLAERGTIVVPTLANMYFLEHNGPGTGMDPTIVDVARRHGEVQRVDFRKALSAGVRIASGSDFIGPPYAPHGENAMELVLMVEEGMRPSEAIKAATAMGAVTLGREHELGTLERGKLADIIALEGDPFDDIRAVLNVPFVMQEGVVLKAEGVTNVEAVRLWL